MRKWLFICGMLLSVAFLNVMRSHYTGGVISYPTSWPEPKYDFEAAGITDASIELGRRLFYDPILSADSSISCSSCHLSFTAFTHVDHPVSHGINDSIGTRNSPVIINIAWSDLLMWDGAVNHLEVQAMAPISNPLEMGETITNVVDKLNRDSSYRAHFASVFGGETITGEKLLKSIAHFQASLVSKDSKYDKVKRGEENYTDQEERGYQLFLEKCNSCHSEPLFTNHEFENNGLPVDSVYKDLGRMGITQNSQDSLKFKVPTLRNIEFSFPYMHDGRFNTLYEVIDHYESGIHESETLSEELRKGLKLTENEKVDLVTFLLTLSDKEFLFNPDFGFPRKKY